MRNRRISEECQFRTGDSDSGVRVDKYIARQLGQGYSRTFVKDLIEKDLVTVNGSAVKPSYSISAGDQISVGIPVEHESCGITPQDISLDIMYEDEDLLVVDKPAGMVVHPGAGNPDGTLVNALVHHCRELVNTGESSRPGIVHRLDKDTSGVMVVAKTPGALRILSRQFMDRDVVKRYIAVVKGHVELDNGEVVAPLGRHPVDRKKMSVKFIRGKKARTVYHVIRRISGHTVLWAEPSTGRTHQIRVHMKHMGHSVTGDDTYGTASPLISRQALHAHILGFRHPATGHHVEYKSPLPEDIKSLIKLASKKEQ